MRFVLERIHHHINILTMCFLCRNEGCGDGWLLVRLQHLCYDLLLGVDNFHLRLLPLFWLFRSGYLFLFIVASMCARVEAMHDSAASRAQIEYFRRCTIHAMSVIPVRLDERAVGDIRIRRTREVGQSHLIRRHTPVAPTLCFQVRLKRTTHKVHQSSWRSDAIGSHGFLFAAL